MLSKDFHWLSHHGIFNNYSPNNTPNANMADHSVGARDESHESEVSQA